MRSATRAARLDAISRSPPHKLREPEAADVIDDLGERAVDIATVVADHGKAEHGLLTAVERSHFGHGHVVAVPDVVLEAAQHAALVLERASVADHEFHR